MTPLDPGPVGLVVPVFDEARRVDEFVPQLVTFVADLPPGSELLLVDDGSQDDTVAHLERLLDGVRFARLLRRPHEGKGAAVAAGLAALSSPVRAFCDLDLSTPPPDLRRVCRAGGRRGVLAIGSRDLAMSRISRPEKPLREALGRAYNRLIQATLAPGVVDTQCGAKAATAEVWEHLLDLVREPGFAWDAELVATALAVGLDVQEVPIEWRHDDRSKVRVLRDGTRMVAATPRIWRRVRAARAHAIAPVVAQAAREVFDDLNAARLAAADRTHWWFRSKAAYVATALRRSHPDGWGPGGWLLDAGAGAGGVTALVGWDPDRAVVVDGNPDLVAQARQAHGLPALQALVDGLPIAPNAVEVVCLLDVIEHLADPVPALRDAARALAPGGRVVVNVPAHRWLWSAADVELGHHRRYSRRLLRDHLAAAGLEPDLETHVFSWLVGPVWMARRLVRKGEAELGLERTGVLVDRAAMVLTAVERLAIGRVRLPLGTSLLCVARRSTRPDRID